MNKILTPALTFAALAFPAIAQISIPVQFDRGSSGTTINGTIIGDEYIDYALGARAGQTMLVGLTIDGTNGNGSVFFNILPPGSDGVAIYTGSMDGRETSLRLTENGEYTNRLYQMGNDRDTGKTSGFQHGLGIE